MRNLKDLTYDNSELYLFLRAGSALVKSVWGMYKQPWHPVLQCNIQGSEEQRGGGEAN